MLILFDENLLSKKLKKPLVDAGHLVQNVEEMGWRGLKDREILTLAEAHPFDVFITADKNLPYQQNFRDLKLHIVVLEAKSTRPDYLLPLITQINALLLSSLAPGLVTLINDAGEVTPFNLSSS